MVWYCDIFLQSTGILQPLSGYNRGTVKTLLFVLVPVGAPQLLQAKHVHIACSVQTLPVSLCRYCFTRIFDYNNSGCVQYLDHTVYSTAVRVVLYEYLFSSALWEKAACGAALGPIAKRARKRFCGIRTGISLRSELSNAYYSYWVSPVYVPAILRTGAVVGTILVAWCSVSLIKRLSAVWNHAWDDTERWWNWRYCWHWRCFTIWLLSSL